MAINAHISTEHSNSLLTVKDFIKNYPQIQESLAVLAQNNFIAESLFTQGYSAEGGGINFAQANGLNHFMNEANDDNEDFSINEGSEFHRVHMTEVTPKQAFVRKYGIEGEITFEEERRNQLGALARMTVRMRNTMVKHLDTVVLSMLASDSNIRAFPVAAGGWSPTSTTVLDELLSASAMVEDEVDAGGTYTPNTLVVSNATYLKLRRNKDIKDYYGPAAPNGNTEVARKFVGEVGELAGLNVLKSRYMRNDMAFVLEKGAIGGIADEVPLYLQEPERIKKREVIELRAGRLTTAFLTDPGAIVRVTGILG